MGKERDRLLNALGIQNIPKGMDAYKELMRRHEEAGTLPPELQEAYNEYVLKISGSRPRSK